MPVTRTEFIIVFGEPRSGKTLNKVALRAHYNCDHVFDDHEIANAVGRILILSTTEDVKDPRDRRRVLTNVLRVPVREAAIALGDKWVEPRDFVRG